MKPSPCDLTMWPPCLRGAPADDLVMGAEDLQPGLVAELLVERGRVLDVREEDGQGAVARRELA